jgi:hypothetical protein
VSGEHDGHGHAHDLRYFPTDAQPEVLPAEADLSFPKAVARADVEGALNEYLARLSAGLDAAGCVLVGHIKGVVAASDGPQAREGAEELAFSVTRLHGAPSFTGGLRGAGRAFRLTLNVIVFGVDADALPGIVTGAWPEAVPASWRPHRHAPDRRGTCS